MLSLQHELKDGEGCGAQQAFGDRMGAGYGDGYSYGTCTGDGGGVSRRHAEDGPEHLRGYPSPGNFDGPPLVLLRVGHTLGDLLINFFFPGILS